MLVVLRQTKYLYSILKCGLVTRIIGPFLSVFFLSSNSRYFYKGLHRLITRSDKYSIKKSFPLKTVMGPCGPITHC